MKTMNIKTMKNRILSIFLATMIFASCMFVSLPEVAHAGSGSQLPSVTRFATPADLVNPNKFTLHTDNGNGVAQKVNFGNGRNWYIAGKDSDGSLVLMYDPANPLDSNWFDDDDNTYKGSVIEDYLQSGALDYFTDAEEALMISPTVYTNKYDSDEIDDTSDKLYLAYGGDLLDNYITVGANSESSLNSGIKIGLTTSNSPNGSPYASISTGQFWLRAPDVNNYSHSHALYATPGYYVNNVEFVTYNCLVVPAFNLDLSHVLFASDAPAASSPSPAFDNAMTFRYENNGQFNSTAEVKGQTLSVTYDAGDSDVYICAQGKDDGDDWFSCEQVTSTRVYTANEVYSGADLSKCRIWLEKYDSTSNLIYAEYASGSNVRGGSHGSSAPISADAPIECEHEFVWQTIEDPNFNFDGLEGEVCSKCGFKGLIVPTSAYSWVLGSYGLPMIEAAKPGDTVVFEFKQWNSFPKWFMERIAAKPDVTYVFKYFYENNNYEVTIKPHTPIPLDFDYYGPEKLAALFESTVTPR